MKKLTGKVIRHWHETAAAMTRPLSPLGSTRISKYFP